MRDRHLRETAWLDKVHAEHCARVISAVRARWSRSLISVDDLDDIWQETLCIALMRYRKNEIDVTLPLVGLLKKIANDRAIDLVRQRSSHERRLSAVRDRLLNSVGEALRGTGVGQRWRARSSLERQELSAELLGAILALPPMQQLVWRTYAQMLPCSIAELAAAVSQALGVHVSKSAVSRAKCLGRDALRKLLRRHRPDQPEAER